MPSYSFQLRSKKETARLHNLSKPPRIRTHIDDLPSIDSHDEEQGSWSDRMEDSDLYSTEVGSEDDDEQSSSAHQEANSDVEQPYELKPRIRAHWGHADSTIPRLPIKLPDGRVVETAGRIIPHASSKGASEDEAEAGPFYEERPQTRVVDDVSTGARFGRPAVADVIGTSSREPRIQMAKEQIAGICQDILADPESSVRIYMCC
jgi:nucleolar complex protein 3